METQTIYDTLAELSIFEGMPPEYLEFLADCAHHVHFKEGAFLIYISKPATHFYLIRKGQVALEMDAANKIVTLQTVGEGSVVGWSWMVPPYTWHFDARAAAPVSAISFDAVRIREECERDPRFGYQMLKRFSSIMIDRLMATRVQLADVYH